MPRSSPFWSNSTLRAIFRAFDPCKRANPHGCRTSCHFSIRADLFSRRFENREMCPFHRHLHACTLRKAELAAQSCFDQEDRPPKPPRSDAACIPWRAARPAGWTVSELMPKGASSPPSCFWVSGLPRAPFRPRPLRVGHQLGHQVGGADVIAVAEGGPDIGQQLDVDRRVMPARPDRSAGRIPRPSRPVAAGQVGNRQQRPPVVGGAVVQGIRDARVRVGQLVEVVGRPARRLPAQDRELVAIAPAQPRNLGGPRLALQLTMMARSSSVSASARMVAIAFGAQVENRRGLCSPLTSTLRMT